MIKLIRRKDIISNAQKKITDLFASTPDVIKKLENDWLFSNEEAKQYQKATKEFLDTVLSETTRFKDEISLISEKSYLKFVSSIRKKQRMTIEKIEKAKKHMEKELINNKFYFPNRKENISFNEFNSMLFEAISEEVFKANVKFDKLICGYYVLIY